MKTCTKCNTEKPLEEFGVDKTTKDGYRYSCKVCYNAQQREYVRNNKELIKARNAAKAKQRKAYYQSPRGIKSSRRAHLKRKYGITLEEYNNLLKQQQSKCKICGQEETSERNSHLCVDHDHNTGAIRGLLCNNCNRALGLFKDNIEVLHNAIIYLQNN